MDRKINIMLDSEECAKLSIFEKELQRLNSLNRELVVRAWLEEQIEKLKEKLNAS